jgi:hypothetical protein
VLDTGGRLYLAKDARASSETIIAGYPNHSKFCELRRRHRLGDRFQSFQSERLGLS